jgi:LuxR family maltose regulon positive regulatory protein
MLADGLHAPLTLVSASAGFGKSTLVAEWIQTRPDLRAVWLSLEPSDNEWGCFFRYFTAAWQTLFPDAGQTALSELSTSPNLQHETLVNALLNDLLAKSSQDIALLVLDDYHRIETPAIHQMVAYFLEHVPPVCRLLLISRADPPLPLARWRSRRLMRELRTNDLRFTPDETAAFLNRAMCLNLTREQVETLETRTEGWVVGLQLAALSLQGKANADEFVRAFGGSHRYVLDYLMEEVVNQQTESARRFLMAISLLENFCAPLCDALLETDPPCAQTMLEQLERANLFIIPLDDQRTWYRYHHLFADLLRVRLRQTYPQEIPALHRRAALWFSQNRHWHRSIQHALAAGDYVLGVDLFEQAVRSDGLDFLFSGIRPLLKPFPAEWQERAPILNLAGAIVKIEASQLSGIEFLLRTAEQKLPDELLGMVYVAQSLAASLLGDSRWIAESSQQVIQRLPGNTKAQVSAWIQLGNVAFYEGDLRENIACWSRALELSLANDYPFGVMASLDNLGRTYCNPGDLNRAETFFQRALDFISNHPSPRWLSATQRDYSDLLRERNQLERAREMMSASLETAAQWNMPSGQGLGYIHMGRILLAQGELPGAWEMLQQAEQVCRAHTVYPDLSVLTQVFRARLFLENGKPAEAWETLQACLVLPCGAHAFHREWLQIAQGRVLLRTDRPQETLDLLENRLDAAREVRRGRNWLEMSLLCAQALANLGREGAALEHLAAALEFAQPQGFIRIFLDEGEAMRALLGHFSQKFPCSAAQPFVTGLLSTFQPETPLSGESLIEPLTGREREILQLVCEGLSNQEIARQLVLSVGTVKTHIHNIFGKLGVSNRPQAIARTRTM